MSSTWRIVRSHVHNRSYSKLRGPYRVPPESAVSGSRYRSLCVLRTQNISNLEYRNVFCQGSGLGVCSHLDFPNEMPTIA